VTISRRARQAYWGRTSHPALAERPRLEPTRVVNLHRESYDVYIGRPGQGQAGPFGNPCKVRSRCPQCGATHEEPSSTLPCYRTYLCGRLADDPDFATMLRRLQGRTLGCFCSPNPCHGDAIARVLDLGFVGAYAGVGSRRTPVQVLEQMERLGRELAAAGWLLSSGAADGADKAWERGSGGWAEIYLPWPGFDGRQPMAAEHMGGAPGWLTRPTPEAYAIARDHYEGSRSWGDLPDSSQALHARDAHQVLGRDLRTPRRFVACWTPNGLPAGGTGTAIRIATRRQIPVFNLAFVETEGEMRDFAELEPSSFLEQANQAQRELAEASRVPAELLEPGAASAQQAELTLFTCFRGRVPKLEVQVGTELVEIYGLGGRRTLTLERAREVRAVLQLAEAGAPHGAAGRANFRRHPNGGLRICALGEGTPLFELGTGEERALREALAGSRLGNA
jgi:hypothetical protein